jgi:hypothetical protein
MTPETSECSGLTLTTTWGTGDSVAHSGAAVAIINNKLKYILFIVFLHKLD